MPVCYFVEPILLLIQYIETNIFKKRWWYKYNKILAFSVLYDAILYDHFTHQGYSTVPKEVFFLATFS